MVKVQDIPSERVQDIDVVSSKDVYMLFVYMYILILCSCLWTTQILPLYWSSYHKDQGLVTIPLLVIVS